MSSAGNGCFLHDQRARQQHAAVNALAPKNITELNVMGSSFLYNLASLHADCPAQAAAKRSIHSGLEAGVARLSIMNMALINASVYINHYHYGNSPCQ